MKPFNFLFVLVVFVAVDAFQVTPPVTSLSSSSRAQIPLLHMAKKTRKRRKRKDPSSPPPSSSSTASSDELPDFDLGDDDEDSTVVEASSAAPKQARKPVDPDEITDAMMGTQKPLGSVKDLIADRSLEKAFQFDEPTDPLPDLSELAAKTPAQPTIGKKKARQEARRAAAIAEEEEGNSILDSVSDALESLPFLKSDRESSPLKLIENATWLGIFLLVLWEVYINSPFFERAAPLSPIVYEDLFM